jgi:drug/metabolite transporter (DMT)-like permease
MIAFASNSLLCRAALKQTTIDPATFTFIRIFAGAVALWLIMQSRKRLIVACRAVAPRRRERTASPLVESFSKLSLVTGHSLATPKVAATTEGGSLSAGNWPSALALFVYAAAFSFAYINLSAGTGALLLFGAVQATMILWGLIQGERLLAIQVAGLITAITGLVALLSPGLSAPPLVGSILMLAAGVAWGIYSIRGRATSDAMSSTTGNFLHAVPLAAAVSVATLPWARLDSIGVIYALISGAITSGVGYVIWYAALPGLKATGAATVQLSVPVLAAAGGIIFLSEPITLRYVLASVAVLGGILLVIIEKRAAT